MYNLPHPASIIESPPDRLQWKKLLKSKVVSYWEIVLREEVQSLKSLCYFKPEFMSLTQSHSLFFYAGHSPFNVAKASVQAIMLSGRYRCGSLTRYWDKSDGVCRLSPHCNELEDLTHILRGCFALRSMRNRLLTFTQYYSRGLPLKLKMLIEQYFNPEHPDFPSFFLDCSHYPSVISLSQELGKGDVLSHPHHLSRTWVFALHRERHRLLAFPAGLYPAHNSPNCL